MKNIVKKIMLVGALMCTGQMFGQIDQSVTQLREIVTVVDCETATVLQEAADFLHYIETGIHRLLAVKPGDEHYNTLSFAKHVEDFTQKISLMDASNLQGRLEEVIASDELSADALPKVKQALDYINLRHAVYNALVKQTKQVPNAIEFLTELKGCYDLLPEKFCKMKQNDVKKLLRIRFRMK